MKNYAVIGLGLFGTQIATQLYKNGKNVLAIDIRAAAVEEIADHVNRAVTADAKKRETLLQLGVNRCDCAIVAMTSDLAASVLVTMNLKALGVPEIICKAQSATDREILETLGATKVIIPEQVAADKLCQRMMGSNVLDYIALSQEHSIVELHSPKSWRGRSLKDINVRAKYGVNVIAVREKERLNVSPEADYTLREDNVLVLLGSRKALAQIQQLR